MAAGGRRPPPAKPKPGPKAPALWALCAPAAPPSGPQRFPQPWRKRGAAAAAASRKGTRQAQGLGAGIGCAAPPSPLRWTRGLGYPGRPGGGGGVWRPGAFGPPACQTKAGAKGPGFVGALRPRRPPPQGRSGSQKRQDKGRPSPLGKIYLSPDKRLFKIQLRRFVQGV